MPRYIKNKKSFTIILSAFFVFPSIFASAQTPAFTPPPTPVKPFTIVIDAGHGGKDGSTHGVFSKEKDVALQVALLLGQTIEKEVENAKVIYTRTEDIFIPLYERIEIANRSRADLFISIHCNSMPANMRNRSDSRGVETFVSGEGRMGEQDVAVRENASILLEKDYKENYEGYNPNDPESVILLSLYKNAFRKESLRLARLVQDEYVKSGRVNRGVKEQSLAVLAKAGMPAILTEIGFISNPKEEEYINSLEGRQVIVQNITNAIKEYNKWIYTK